jgi:superfamily II DNA or RNA helicase
MAELHEWQNAALDYFKEHNQCIFEAATGTGKTFLTIALIKYVLSEHPDYKVLIVVPKNVILEDTWYKELASQFSLVDIGLYYGEVKEESRITITNMQNIHRLNLGEYQFHIYDELHNYMTSRMLIHLNKYSAYKVGLTATLHRKDYAHWRVMLPFGFNKFQYSLEEGVEDNILSKYHFHNIGIKMPIEEFEEYQAVDQKISFLSILRKEKKWNDEDKRSLYKLIDKRRKLLGLSKQKMNALGIVKDKIKDKKIIIFNEYNASAPLCYWALLEYGFSPCIFNTDLPKKKRMQNLDDYREGKFDTIITTRALDEGYNLPKIDVAIILCGGNSDRQMIQRVGRALRKKDTDTHIFQIYFIDTIEEEYSYKRYELMRNSCSSFENIREGEE